MTKQNLKAQYHTLDSLLDAMTDGALSERGSDWSSLPTYGGETPNETWGVWSWDETRLLVGQCSSDVEIVDRADWSAR